MRSWSQVFAASAGEVFHFTRRTLHCWLGYSAPGFALENH